MASSSDLSLNFHIVEQGSVPTFEPVGSHEVLGGREKWTKQVIQIGTITNPTGQNFIIRLGADNNDTFFNTSGSLAVKLFQSDDDSKYIVGEIGIGMKDGADCKININTSWAQYDQEGCIQTIDFTEGRQGQVVEAHGLTELALYIRGFAISTNTNVTGKTYQAALTINTQPVI
jgi:hypothetical protein